MRLGHLTEQENENSQMYFTSGTIPTVLLLPFFLPQVAISDAASWTFAETKEDIEKE